MEAEEVSDVMKAYYKLFNNKNIEGVRDFWLPFSLCELVLPGYPKAVRLPVLRVLNASVFY